ncbi:hypothetical protein SY27_07075 [Flavobacterium sp. 316]|uniref:hypothetical protein n=1 Tax=Flavobacterium sp. 316 TaxID=1603293 RepID=UPI0005DA76C3|nr:hypothetical protein [Flavobacterium sp. 316]KIX21465.1 hypothetical protein SY27_07075 [Flavobacterium sp. 316]
MDDLNEKTWYSGDWNTGKDNNTPPYNGIKITAKANYNVPVDESSTQSLTSVDLEIADYTYDINGVSSYVSLSEANTWYTIPIPENTNVSPSEPNSNFTITGIDTTKLGNVELNSNVAGLFVNIEFKYGAENEKREELGFIMKIEETYIEGTDSIIVNGK